MSNIELVRIDENNFMQAFNLKLAKEQEQFVSNPIRSLAQAYVTPLHCIYIINLVLGKLEMKMRMKLSLLCYYK